MNFTTGSRQGGWAENSGAHHAALWHGVVSSFMDLNPVDSSSSEINALNDSKQVGYITVSSGVHAVVWSGFFNAFVDLHPTGYTSSDAFSIGDSAQPDAIIGGMAALGGVNHACIWRGTADSFVDLHPPGATNSQVRSGTGTLQVGSALINGADHAAYWAATVGSFVDLQSVLPANYSDSEAYGVWTDGTTTLVVGGATNQTTGQFEAILWKLAPAPILSARISGKKKVTTTRARLAIKGHASDAGGSLDRVEVRIGHGPFRSAHGTTSWKITAKLKRGRNIIQVRAVDAYNILSPTARLIVTRS